MKLRDGVYVIKRCEEWLVIFEGQEEHIVDPETTMPDIAHRYSPPLLFCGPLPDGHPFYRLPEDEGPAIYNPEASNLKVATRMAKLIEQKDIDPKTVKTSEGIKKLVDILKD